MNRHDSFGPSAPAGARNSAPTRLRVCTFKGLQNLPLYVAQRQGYFAARGLDIEIVYTNGSKPQIADLIGGKYDLVQTAPDNVVNVDNNPAAFGLDPAHIQKVIMVLGGSNGPLSLYAQSSITNFEALRGSVLGVDNPTSGFALVLRDMLARHDLQLERDYTFTVAGGTHMRLDALERGTIPATILYTPFDIQAAQSGCSRLAISTDYYPAYASLCTAGMQPWLETHASEVTGYIAAVLDALHWIYDQEHATSVQDIMVHEPALALEPALTKQAYTAFVSSTGFGVDALLDDAGLQQVIDIRAAYSERKPQGSAADYRDLRWYQRARP